MLFLFLANFRKIEKVLRKVGMFTLSAKANTSAVDLHINQPGVFKTGFILVDWRAVRRCFTRRCGNSIVRARAIVTVAV